MHLSKSIADPVSRLVCTCACVAWGGGTLQSWGDCCLREIYPHAHALVSDAASRQHSHTHMDTHACTSTHTCSVKSHTSRLSSPCTDQDARKDTDTRTGINNHTHEQIRKHAHELAPTTHLPTFVSLDLRHGSSCCMRNRRRLQDIRSLAEHSCLGWGLYLLRWNLARSLWGGLLFDCLFFSCCCCRCWLTGSL